MPCVLNKRSRVPNWSFASARLYPVWLAERIHHLHLLSYHWQTRLYKTQREPKRYIHYTIN